ncbi:diphthamide biosynthesis protein 2 [Nannizzia gypsea CBS 118893]|uniref:2-(3-amino-3-carboxypropyl)histidine synthase subunit 2 n=1 Tax=Arthroderma gypseum (strain ATCC MYA-4604 / CBS 118893) TaxID=535722 RepID=E4UQD3_ARTGP|nr:diphthamide biosynthesis protein 2 [Nannizzia gypsea CBS 118893]EFR00003.1 diphthamide biosynthesis protein 2 [Nannizzia gypsea CBS 118893]
MTEELKVAPVLSTPDTRILEEAEPTAVSEPIGQNLSDEEFRITYDIERTIKEIKEGKWQRIALQFPDDMLPDAPRVFQLLSRGLSSRDNGSQKERHTTTNVQEGDGKDVEDVANSIDQELNLNKETQGCTPKLYILADTSYGTCCVDEVAAEHVEADVVVHYGRSCLSPTARLPVIYIFTCRPLNHDAVIQAFEESYPDHGEKVVIAADVTYAAHVDEIATMLTMKKGYTNIFATQVVHNPSSPIPNRTIPPSVEAGEESLNDWQLFHISDPPTSLLLTLSSRVAAIRIYPTGSEAGSKPGSGSKALLASTAISLRRRYAILTSLNTAPIFGILVNTLSVKNYLHIVQHVQRLIAAAGKKSYLFVVGKLNVAKVANFSEIEGWVIIGCWESSLVDSREFWRPVITPYELELALQSDDERIWTGAWSSDYQSLLKPERNAASKQKTGDPISSPEKAETEAETAAVGNEGENEDEAFSEPESAPPEFDLRTGRYVSTSNTRPMQAYSSTSPSAALSSTTQDHQSAPGGGSKSLAKRFKSDVATIGGVVSPGAEFLKSNRSWRGLGSDFVVEYEDDNGQDGGLRGSAVVEGLSGIARGYRIGENQERR